MKRIIVILLAAVMLTAVLAGCGGTQDGQDAGDDVRVVTVWLHKAEADDEGKIYRALADQFNDAQIQTADGTKTLRMRVEFKGTADTLSTAISSEILTGGLPDIIAIDASQYAAYQEENVIVPIDEYITAEQMASYVPSVIEQSTIDGRLYGLSGMDAPGGLYYNKNIVTAEVLSKAGIDDYATLESPWSWNDVLSVLRVLRADNQPHKMKLNLGFGGAEGSMYLYSSLVYSAGGEFSRNGSIEAGLTSEETIGGIQSLEKIIRNEDGDNYMYMGENPDAFAQGEVPMQIFGPWDITTINKSYPEFKDSYGIMPMPVFEDGGRRGTIASPCGSWGFAVTRDSRYADDAAIVVEFLTGKDASHMMFQGIGTFPTNKELFDELEVFTEEGPMKSLAGILINTAVPRPVMPSYPKLASAYSDILEYIETMVNDSSYDLRAFVTDKAQEADR